MHAGVRIIALVAMALVCWAQSALAQSGNVRKVYCIDGAANASEWAWEIERSDGTTLCSEPFTPEVAPSGNEADDEQALAGRFANSHVQRCGSDARFGTKKLETPLVAANCPAGWLGGYQFVSTGDFDLLVAPAGTGNPSGDCTGGADDQGKVGRIEDGNTCNFNALVGRGSADQGTATVNVPTLAEWGRVALVALIALASLPMLARRARGATG